MDRVLIVENDPMVASIIKRYLESIGDVAIYGPVSTLNDINEILEKHKINLILLDAYLPQKSGFEVLRLLRKRKYYDNVIMITAANSVEEVKRAYAYGVVDYIMKPFEYNRFKKAFEKHLFRSEILAGKSVLEQSDLDKNAVVENKISLPKGLNPITMSSIEEKLNEDKTKEWTIRELAKEMGISNVTIKKYLDYLEQSGDICSNLTTGQVGRPEFRYFLRKY